MLITSCIYLFHDAIEKWWSDFLFDYAKVLWFDASSYADFLQALQLNNIMVRVFSEKTSKKSTQSFKKYEFVENQINNEIRFYQIPTIS